MEIKHQDAVLWITLGLFGYCAARAAHNQLLAVRTAVEVTEEEKPQELINQQTENALKLDTLRQLAEGSNHDIRVAALKIITERSAQGPTYDLILHDIAGRDIERRNKALTSLTFLIASPARFSLNKRETYEAIIDCLCNFLPSHQKQNWPSNEYTNFKTRTQAEKDALIVLERTLPYNMAQAISAGIVSRWLSKYPFCGSSVPEARKVEAVQQLKTWNTEDTLMCEILSMIDDAPEGRKELRKHRLVGSAIGETDDEEGDTLMIGGEDTAGLSIGSAARGRRIREESIEEQALRRRRREAMVLSEGGRPLGRDDIIQRDNVVSDEDVEQDLERLIEDEARREDEERVGSSTVEHNRWGWTRWLFQASA